LRELESLKFEPALVLALAQELWRRLVVGRTHLLSLIEQKFGQLHQQEA
jgi:hypothetical protein